MKTFLVIVGVLVLLAAAVVGGGWWWMQRAKAADTSLAVRIENVTRGDLVETVSAPGVVQAKTRVQISARVAARIDQLPFEEGATVTKGNADAKPPIEPSLLVRLDDKDMQALLRQAEARRSAEAAQIEVAKAKVSAQDSQIQLLRIQLARCRARPAAAARAV